MLDRSTLIWNDSVLDSDEEYLFLCWLMEAESLGLLRDISRSESYELSAKASRDVAHPTKTKPGGRKSLFLLHPHSYRPDFSFRLTLDIYGHPELDKLRSTSQRGLLPSSESDDLCVVDVKGGWSNHRSRNSSDVTFPLNQKWMYAEYGIFVNKVEIKPKTGFFDKYWAPKQAFTTIKGNSSRKYATARRSDQIERILADRVNVETSLF